MSGMANFYGSNGGFNVFNNYYTDLWLTLTFTFIHNLVKYVDFHHYISSMDFASSKKGSCESKTTYY